MGARITKPPSMTASQYSARIKNLSRRGVYRDDILFISKEKRNILIEFVDSILFLQTLHMTREAARPYKFFRIPVKTDAGDVRFDGEYVMYKIQGRAHAFTRKVLDRHIVRVCEIVFMIAMCIVFAEIIHTISPRSSMDADAQHAVEVARLVNSQVLRDKNLDGRDLLRL